MTVYNHYFYLFGGKMGSFNETNELWRFDFKTEVFKLIHDTVMEFEKEEKKHEKKKSMVTGRTLGRKDKPAYISKNTLVRRDKSK